jgi:hypothetical protein
VQALARMQRGLEMLYRVDTGVEVGDYVIDEAAREALAPARKPREQLLVMEDTGEMALALFIHPAVLANLAAHDPGRLGEHNLGDFLLAIEGVSHFIYAIQCARADRPVTQLELELQAEVDKYVTCVLQTEPAMSEAWRQRLFGDCAYDDDLDHAERERYEVANDNANRYAAWLEETFVRRRRIPAMLGELRRFYREGLAGKLATIARAA